MVHKQYNPNSLIHDIALLKLPNQIQTQASVQIIPLPTADQVNTLVIGEPAIASGWGWPSDATKGISVNLRFVSLPIVAQSVCEVTYGILNIFPTNICVSGASGKGTW